MRRMVLAHGSANKLSAPNSFPDNPTHVPAEPKVYSAIITRTPIKFDVPNYVSNIHVNDILTVEMSYIRLVHLRVLSEVNHSLTVHI